MPGILEPIPSTMLGVVFEGPGNVQVQRRPTPRIEHEGDIIVRITAAGLCGSDLHVYRGHEASSTGYIMGHEFAGIVVAVGKDVNTIKIHDKVVSPFTVSCQCLVFGTPTLDGAQAEYIRVPLADSTVVKAPAELSDDAIVLMADVFPTGFFGASNGFRGLSKQDAAGSVVVIIGCGPVGLSALVSSLEYQPKEIFAIDNVESRLDIAASLGAQPLQLKDGNEHIIEAVHRATDGRGADIVIEVVGQKEALKMAFELIRPFGTISSLGAHHAEMPFTATDGYNKNIKLHMGRCPVRSIFFDALEVLVKHQDKFGFMFQKSMPLSSAADGYDLFSKMRTNKIIFRP